MVCRKVSWTKKCFWEGFLMSKWEGRPWWAKTSISHYTCCKIWIFWELWTIKKIDAKRCPKHDQHRSLWEHRVGFLRFWSVLEKGDLLRIFDWPKVVPENQNKNEGSPSRGQGGERIRKRSIGKKRDWKDGGRSRRRPDGSADYNSWRRQ